MSIDPGTIEVGQCYLMKSGKVRQVIAVQLGPKDRSGKDRSLEHEKRETRKSPGTGGAGAPWLAGKTSPDAVRGS
jgi:hypothetical protein